MPDPESLYPTYPIAIRLQQMVRTQIKAAYAVEDAGLMQCVIFAHDTVIVETVNVMEEIAPGFTDRLLARLDQYDMFKEQTDGETEETQTPGTDSQPGLPTQTPEHN